MKQKLKSSAGASMLLALLFLFFALSVGAVVLTAASANAGRAARLRQEQQDYFAVQSAARLLRDDLQSLIFTGSHTKTVSETTTYTDNEDGTSDSHTSSSGPYYALQAAETRGATLASLLQQDFKAQYQAGIPGYASETPETHILELKAPTLDGLAPVTASVTLRDGYLLVAELSETENAAHRMTLTLRGKPSSTHQTEQFDYSSDNSSTTESVTTYTTSVTFEPGVITKGAAA